MKLRWLLYIPVFLFLTWFSGYSILHTKIQELNIYLEKQKIQNYELSNRLLRSRFRRMLQQKYRNNTVGEIKINVLESHVLNRDMAALQSKLSVFMTPGKWIVNGTRFLLLKEPINLREDARSLSYLKYAFFLERQKRFKEAGIIYAKLMKMVGSRKSHEQAFIYLHYGYCLALSGDRKQALQKLRFVQKHYAGNSYEETATLMIRLLMGALQDKLLVQKMEDTDAGQARQYFKFGLYQEAIRSLKKRKTLTEKERIMLLRSQEESGQVKIALKGYQKILEKSKDRKIHREANRRILLLSRFSPGRKKTLDQAERKAIELGDTEFIKELDNSAKRYRSYKPSPSPKGSETKEPELSQIRREILKSYKQDFGAPDTPRLKKSPRLVEHLKKTSSDSDPGDKGKKKKIFSMQLSYSGGRSIFISSLKYANKTLTVRKRGISIDIDYPKLQKIQLLVWNGAKFNLAEEFRLELKTQGGRSIRGNKILFKGKRLVIYGRSGKTIIKDKLIRARVR